MIEWGFGGFLGEALLAVDSWACYLGGNFSSLCDFFQHWRFV